MMQQFAYETLVAALRRLHPKLYREFLVRVLGISLDMNQELEELPIATLAEMLFANFDSTTEPKAMLRLQNIISHVSLCLCSVIHQEVEES